MEQNISERKRPMKDRSDHNRRSALSPAAALLGSVRAEFIFSGESLRLTGQGLLFGLLTGAVVGLCGGAFARLLDLCTLLREGTVWAVLLLPLAGLPVVWMYRRGGIKTAGGTDLIIQAARGEQPVSRVLAPVIFAATLLTHAFGGSAGREGAALQLGGSLAELVRKLVRIGDEFEDLAIMCGMSAGFSAVCGNQISAVIFALEISCVGVLPLGALFPCVVSSIVARMTAGALRAEGVSFTLSVNQSTPLFYGKVMVLGVVCGLLSIVVCYTLSGTQTVLEGRLPNPYLRIVLGGVAVTALTLALGTKVYLGTGQNLIALAIRETTAAPWDFALKLLFTALTIGAGFKGGEIVPSFAIGAAFGCAVGPLLGLPASYAAAVGMIAVFCGVTNCPLTSMVLGFEVFSFCNPGGFLVAVAASFLASGYSGLYAKQKFAFSKLAGPEGVTQEEDSVRHRQ